MRYLIILALLVSIALVACGAPASTATPTPKVIQTEGLEPTPTPPSTATPYPTYTPYPTPLPTPDVEAIVNERVKAVIDNILAQTPTPTFTPEPTPTRMPTPTPEPAIRPVAPPETNALANVLQISSISMDGRTLSIAGRVEGHGYDPTVIQVWQAYDPEPYSETCSTERPVAFVQPGNGSVVYSGQLTPYTWTFCTQYQKGKPQTDQVPWLYSQSWSYSLRHRNRTTDPYIYDFGMSVNLDHERVERLEYGNAASGWRVIVWSGENIIANQWLEY